MATVKVYNSKGDIVGDHSLNDAVFAVAVKPEVVHQVVVAQQANARQVVAHTKDRSEVRGGGKKPWKQKGTGRARHGSSRSPLWRGGGITFGPRNDRNYSLKINKKMKNVALRMVLSDKVAHDKFIVIDSLQLEAGKTKQLSTLMSKLPVHDHKALIVLGTKDELVIRSAKNLHRIGYVAADSLNVVDILKYEYLVIDQTAVDKIMTVYSK